MPEEKEQTPISDKDKLFSKLDLMDKRLGKMEDFINVFSKIMEEEKVKAEPKTEITKEPKEPKKTKDIFDELDMFSIF